jgi:nucleoside-diphosphate-sugar epimerase
MRCLVTGGCGYCGSVLVPKLLKAGHIVRVLDVQWFGNYLAPHKNLKVIRGDIRDQTFPVGATDAIIHLAGVANDPTGDLDPKLTWGINVLATHQLVDRAAREGVKQFIYASSGSVYGVSDKPEVTEDEPLVPISEYNKTKAVAERVLLSYADRMTVQIIRPATVCGFSPRFRADVLVNMLTLEALTNGKIHLQNPGLYRPNIHIDDITDAYLFFLDRPELTGIYNAGFENYTIREVARVVAEWVKVRITEVKGSKDTRSYRINSDKLLRSGFDPQKTVSNAIHEIIEKFRAGKLKDDPLWHNVRQMRILTAA